MIRSRTGAHLGAMIAGIVVLALLETASAQPRIAPLTQRQLSDEQREIVDALPSPLTNAVATYLHHPTLTRNLLPFEHFISSESSLPARARALVILRTAWLCRSNYVWAHHAAAARVAGISEDELEQIAIGPYASGWNAFEAALLMAADELHVDSFISDATWSRLAERYTNEQLADLVFTAAEFTMVAGTVNSLRVEIEPGLEDRLPYGIPFTVPAKWTNKRLIGAEPRLAPLQRAQWTAEMRRLLDPNDSGRDVANVYKTYIHSFRMDVLRRHVSEHIRDETTLSDRQREILLIRIGVLCRSEYEWAAHSRVGRAVGMSESEIARIVAGPGRENDGSIELALLRAADELYRDDFVSDETWASLAAQFDAAQLLDILTAVGGYRMFSMAINTFGVQLDDNMADARFPPHLR
jgi:alkylhydroperoxidase family enzyme